jgi:hypothetical protein
MEEQPSFEASQSEAKGSRQERIAGFVKQLVVVLVISFVGSALYTLIVGPQNTSGFSNGLFIVGAMLLVIGLLPLLSDIFGRSTMTLRKKDQTLKDIMDGERERSQRDSSISSLLTVGGFIVIFLSFIIGFSMD